jgi:hypothetical protein
LNNSNYNNLYSYTSNFGYYTPNTIASLAAWRTTSGKDPNSISHDPIFESGESGVPTAVYLDSAALPLGSITTDITGRARNASDPDIGAFEYDVIYFDATSSNITRDTVCPNEEIYIQIKNMGYSNLNTLTLEWAVSFNMGPFVSQTSVPINAGGLVKGDSLQINLGKYPFVYGNVYRIKAYTHTPNGRQDQVPDADTHITTIQVYNTPTVSISGLPSFCETDAPYIITQGTPSGGWFTGNGAFKSYFRPRIAGAGSHVLTYSWADGNGCAGSDSTVVIVHPGPIITMPSTAAVCPNQPSFMLSGYSPTGGTWTGGAWLSGTTFNPANAVPGANNWIKYKVVSANGCADSSTKWIRLDTLPIITLTGLPSVCENGNPVTLIGGKPIGGSYSGVGVSSGQFDPAQVSGAGQHSIRYAFTDGNGCSDSTTANLTVEAKPAINMPPIAKICPKTSATFSVNNPNKIYLWSTGDTTESITTDNPKVYQVTVTDPSTANQCKNEASIEVVMEEVCVGLAANPTQKFEAVLYPNPNKGSFSIAVKNMAIGNYSLEITSLSGAMIHYEPIRVQQADFNLPVLIPNVAPGSYLLRINGEHGYFQSMLSIY